MALCIIMRFTNVDAARYDAVMAELDPRPGTASWPAGGISHVAGAGADGWYVIDVWETQGQFDAFLQARLGPALAKVGGISPPQITALPVHNMQRAEG